MWSIQTRHGTQNIRQRSHISLLFVEDFQAYSLWNEHASIKIILLGQKVIQACEMNEGIQKQLRNQMSKFLTLYIINKFLKWKNVSHFFRCCKACRKPVRTSFDHPLLWTDMCQDWYCYRNYSSTTTGHHGLEVDNESIYKKKHIFINIKFIPQTPCSNFAYINPPPLTGIWNLGSSFSYSSPPHWESLWNQPALK